MLNWEELDYIRQNIVLSYVNGEIPNRDDAVAELVRVFKKAPIDDGDDLQTNIRLRDAMLGESVRNIHKANPTKKVGRPKAPIWKKNDGKSVVELIQKKKRLPVTRQAREEKRSAFDMAAKTFDDMGIEGMNPSKLEEYKTTRKPK